ncbi:hypothetical protein DFH11DRAFT_1741202 [Phellopilus nigrolimitatus]|nr:hypothetical protein DFH11DRAFT_1741202 [Phellopilus nigrolimitatus]
MEGNDTNSRKRAYSIESESASTSLDGITQASDSKAPRSVKSTASTGCRQRVTVVCSECKRLKLKCDRRTPCASCLKRDTVERCVYSQAASEKIYVLTSASSLFSSTTLLFPPIYRAMSDRTRRTHRPRIPRDVQSLNIRLSVLEEKVNNAPGSSALVTGGQPSSAATMASLASSLPASPAERPRAFLAVGTHGASVAVNLEGAAGLWVDHLGLSIPTAKVAAAGEGTNLNDVELLPFPTIPEEGVVDFLTDYTRLFRLPESLASDDTGSDTEDDESRSQIGVSPELVLVALPPSQLRSEIYPRLEAAHIMAPCSTFKVFRQRIEDMCRWAKLTFEGSLRADDEPPPIVPTLSFFAAAAIGLALGAQCLLAERSMAIGYDASSTSVATADGRSPSVSSPSVPGSVHNAVDRSMPPPPVPSPSSPSEAHPSNSFNASLPARLYRLSKLAIGLSLERAGYDAFDIDYLHAKTLQARYLLVSHHGLNDGVNLLSSLNPDQRKKVHKRGKGKLRDNIGAPGISDAASGDIFGHLERSKKGMDKDRGPTLALAPEMVGVVSEMVGNARMMGLNHDPDIVGEKMSTYEKEIRRRLWWEIVTLDAFVADCLGESPLINDNKATTRLPSDVDDESFGPGSTNLPAPNAELLQGNIDYFIQRCRLVELVKGMKRKLNAFREIHNDAHPSETRGMLDAMKIEIQLWLTELPDHLKLKEVPSLGMVPCLMDMKGMSPPKRSSATPGDQGTPPATQYESPFIIAMRCDLAISARYAFVMLCLPFTKETSSRTDSDDFASSGRSFDILFMMEPAMFIVRTWQFLHSIFKYVRPSMFMCYSFTRQLFDTAIVLGHMAIQQPLYAAPALGSVRAAVEVLRDPSVLTGRPTMNDSRSLPSEAVRIVEELVLKAESAFGGSSGTAVVAKRKHEEVDGAGNDFLYHFRFPYVGTGVVSAGPPVSTRVPAIGSAASPLTDSASALSGRTTEPTLNRSRLKQSPVDKGAMNIDPRPAATKLKSSHAGLSAPSRPQKSKDSARARANSNASARSDAPTPSVILNPLPPPSHQGLAKHPTLRVPEPPTPQASYQLSTSKPSLSLPSQNYIPHQSSSSSSDFPANYRSGGFSPPSYPQPYSHQNVPIPVSVSPQTRNSVNFASYGAGPSDAGIHPPSTHEAHPFSSSNGIDYPVTVHQQSEYEATLPGIAHSSVTPQDNRFARGSVDPGSPISQDPPTHQSHHQPFHVQPPTQAQTTEQMPAQTPTQPSWSQTPVYDWHGYYQ